MKSKEERHGHRGFTLIELLVVVGIVAVLAAILFPVFAGIRERGRRTQCLSNERQLGMAISQYAADNGETLFVAGTEPHGFGYAGFGLGWAGRCFPYVKDVGVSRCPDDLTANVAAGNSGSMNNWSMFAISYGFNSNLAGEEVVNGLGTSIPSVTFGQIVAPARTVLLFEVGGNVAAITTLGADEQSAFGNTVNGEALCSVGAVTPEATSPSGYSVSGIAQYATGNMDGVILNGATVNGVVQPGKHGSDARHGDGANYAACDGHVAWLRPEQVSPGYDVPLPGELHLLRNAAATADTKYALTFSKR